MANAAQAGLLAAEAAIEQKRTDQEKQHKHTVKMEEEHKEKAQKAESEANQKTNKLAADEIEKNTARLKALPQLTQDLYGMLMDASTGDPVPDAEVMRILNACEDRQSGTVNVERVCAELRSFC